MARTTFPDTTRYIIDNSQIVNALGNIDKSTLKDFEAQIKYITKAIESATNDIVKVTTHIDQVSGLATASFDVNRRNRMAEPAIESASAVLAQRYGYAPDFYNTLRTEQVRTLEYHRTLKGKESQRLAKEALEEIGGEAVLAKTHKNKERMAIRYPVTEAEYQQQVQALGGDKEAKAYFAKQMDKTIKDARSASTFESTERKEKTREEQEREEHKQEAKEEKANKRQISSLISLIIAIITAIADITRRILTATLTKATETTKQAMDAKAIGITQESAREYGSQERVMGLQQGTILKAMKEIQDALGNITNLNENTIKELARVLSQNTMDMINVALGKNDPESAMSLILREYFNRGLQGVNSIGQYVGQYQAERELASALEKAGLGDLAEVLRNMFYVNDTGIYKGRIGSEDPFADYMSLFIKDTMGLSAVDRKHVAELGQVIEQLKEKFNLLRENLEMMLLPSLEKLINKINAWDIGKSAEEKKLTIQQNIKSNEQAKEAMTVRANVARSMYEASFAKAGIDFSKMGDFSSVDEFLEYRAKNPYWDPETKEGQEEYAKLLDFLRTDEGFKTLHLIQTRATAEAKAKKASEDIKKGLKTGKVVFDASEYTDAKFQQDVKAGVKELWTDKNSPIIRLMKDLQGNNAMQAFITKEGLYQEYIDTYLGGRDITYEDALASGESKNLTKALQAKIQDYLKDKQPNVKRSWEKRASKLPVEDEIKLALSLGYITQEDVKALVIENIDKMGWGTALDSYSVTSGVLKSKGLAGFESEAGALTALAQGLELSQAQDFFTRASGNVTATVGGYNPKTSEVTVRLVAEGANGQEEEILRFRTDAIVGDKEYEYDLGDITGKAQERNSTF